MSTCSFCSSPADAGGYQTVMGDTHLCRQCARLDIISWLADCDKEEVTKLRRRAEDCLRKNPSILREVLVRLITEGAIDYEDCM